MDTKELTTLLKDISKTIQGEHDNYETLFNESLCIGYWPKDSVFNLVLLERGIVLKCEECVGGEGEGDHYHVVFSVTKDGVTNYFKIDGYWASHYGVTIDAWDFYEVESVYVQTRVWNKL